MRDFLICIFAFGAVIVGCTAVVTIFGGSATAIGTWLTRKVERLVGLRQYD